VDEVIVYERPGVHDGTGGILRLARELKARNFHLAVCLQNAIEAAIIIRLAGIPVRAGYNSDGRGFLLTHAVRRTRAIKKVRQTDYYLAMVRSLGCDEGEGGPYLRLSAEDGRAAKQLLHSYDIDVGGFLVGIAPGATYGPAKKWFPERFAALADRLKDDFNAHIILFGSDIDRETTKSVQQAAGHSFVDLAGRTNLRTAVSLIAQCGLFVSNDSGLMHVAGALDIPTVAVFGSTNPVTTPPLGEKSVIIYKGVDCSPCLKETCPTDFRCMEMIGTDEVYSTVRKLLCRE
jgi:heptosyltransferase-2